MKHKCSRYYILAGELASLKALNYDLEIYSNEILNTVYSKEPTKAFPY